jgi:diaminopimelate epimerase
VQLTKHHGLGNDFLVVLDEMNGRRADIDGALARHLCDRRTGVGADGLIHGAQPDEAQAGVDVIMHLFNADGSRAEMSGNGIRCLAQAVAIARDVHEAKLHIATDVGVREVVVHEDVAHRGAMASVAMGPARPGPAVPEPLAGELGGRYETVDMGNPHLVVEVSDPASIDLTTQGSWLEQQFPDGINVEFIARSGDDQLTLTVWERGVGVTQACGTGACAAAVAAHRWGLVGQRVRVEMPGGVAEVELGDEVVLVGPAQLVATIEVADALVAKQVTDG